MAREQAKMVLIFPSMIEMAVVDLQWWCEDIGVFYAGSTKLVMSEAIQKHLYPVQMEAKKVAEAKANKTANAKTAPKAKAEKDEEKVKSKMDEIYEKHQVEESDEDSDDSSEDSGEEKADKESVDESDEVCFQIFVINFVGKTLTFDVKPSDAIIKVKVQIRDKEGTKSLKFRLVDGTKDLDNFLTVSYYKIKKSSTLHMLRWLKGGGNVLIFSWKSFCL